MANPITGLARIGSTFFPTRSGGTRTIGGGSVGGIGILVTIDDRELRSLIEDVGRAANNVERTVSRRLKDAAGQMKDIVANETPVYSGGGQGNQPGILRDSWEVESAGKLAYQIVTNATSKEGTQWAISYRDVIEIITRGHSAYQIWPRSAGFTSLPGYGRYTIGGKRGQLAWQEGGEWVTTPMVLNHPIKKNDFLEKAMDHSNSLLEQVAYDCVFDIEMDIIHGSGTPFIGRGLPGL